MTRVILRQPMLRNQRATRDMSNSQPKYLHPTGIELMQRLQRLFQPLLIFALIVTLCSFAVTGQLSAQSAAGVDLTALKPGLEKITAESVKTTVSYLASDEMAGRDTPSRELDLAADYVAKRLSDAGLSGAGDEGSFFQTTTIATSAVPQDGITLTRDGKPVKHYGMLSAGNEPLSFSGEIKFLGEEIPRDEKFSGPVCVVAGDFEDQRAASRFFSSTVRLRQNGATAVLVQVAPEHSLVARAAAAARPKIINPRGGIAGHVLLVEKFDAGGEFKLELPKQINGESEVRNVMGVLKGSDPDLANEAIIFSAHLDHIGQRGQVGDTIFNGADDNASGVTAVLTLADAFAALPNRPKRSVIFMTYWGEERGLLGSRYYVNHPTWPLEKTVANVNIEMIGRPEDGAAEKCWVTGWDKSDLGELINQSSQAVGVLVFEHPKFSAMLYRQSDNYSFAEKGVIAHSFSAGSLHTDYHQVTDEVAKLQIPHMKRVIEGLFVGCIPLANGEVTPKKSGSQ